MATNDTSVKSLGGICSTYELRADVANLWHQILGQPLTSTAPGGPGTAMSLTLVLITCMAKKVSGLLQPLWYTVPTAIKACFCQQIEKL